MIELWKDIKGYKGKYQISNFGRVKSNTIKSRGKLLKLCINKKGYYRINFFKNGIKKNYSVHRLVADSFIKNPKNKLQINHKDSNKTNNNVNNLEWATNSENLKHAFKMGMLCSQKGENHNCAKFTNAEVKQIRQQHALGNITYSALARDYNVNKTTIRLIVIRKTWRHIK